MKFELSPPKYTEDLTKRPWLKYLILSGAIGGIGTGCWYVAEAGAIMTLAPTGARGMYLALWIVARNLGQLVGGAIKLVFRNFNEKKLAL